MDKNNLFKQDEHSYCRSFLKQDEPYIVIFQTLFTQGRLFKEITQQKLEIQAEYFQTSRQNTITIIWGNMGW